MDFYKGDIPIIDTESAKFNALLEPGDGFGKGYEERDYGLYPEEMFQQPDEMTLYDESEWDALYDAQEEQKSSLEHLYLRGGKPAFLNLDQNGQGFCWAYSTTQAIMLTRLVNNQPAVRLSAHALACRIKNFRDEGGWCGLSAKGHREFGCPSVEFWEEKSMSRSYDKPETWENAKLHRITEDWVDLTKQVYDQNLTRKQLATLGFNNQAGAVDFNWWGHSVCFVRWVRISRGNWGILILNSWKGWGRHGLGVLEGSKAIPVGAVGIRVVGGSAK